MIYKPCPPPKDGGSAKGCVRYILGYELGTKHEEWEIRNASYHALILEAQQRSDFGVGVVWRPTVGQGIRPSSVLALNVGTLGSADIEMQGLFQANKRAKTPTHHEVFSFGNDDGLTDEQALDAVRRVYEKVGLGGAAMVMAVHRDTFHDDGRVKLHVHVARSGIDPMTLRAYNHQRINTRIDRASRVVELEMQLLPDRGLAVRDHAADGTPFVRDSTVPERIAWRRELREERLVSLERARYVDNALREGSFERWAEARVEPRLREVLGRAKDAGLRSHAIDVQNAAARLGCLVQVDAGELILRDVSTGRLREQQRAELELFREKSAGAKSLVRDELLAALEERQRQELAAEVRRLVREGESAPLTPKMVRELHGALGDPGIFADEIAVERAFVDAVDRDVTLVARTLTQTSSTFSRDDVDRYLVERIADVAEIERLAERVLTEDPNLVLLGQLVLTDPNLVLHSPDEIGGVWTTQEMLAIERQVAEEARTLVQRPDSSFSDERRAAAITAMEADRSKPDEPFRLSNEQREALSKHGGLVAILGGPGAGKTVCMEAIRRDAERAGRKVQGITTAQAAAIRLEVEAGFPSVNSAYALLADNPRRELIPHGGVLVLDEAAMIDSRTMRAILHLARDRGTSVVAIGDPRQIQAVGAGGPWYIIEQAAREAGTFAELHENRRQKRAFHRDAVALTGLAIEKEDAPTFARAADLLENNGALEIVGTKDDAISGLVAWYQRERAKSEDVLLVSTDRDTVRYLNEEMLRRREGRGFEHRYLTDGGTRGLAVGDRFIFGENNARIGVANGDTGRVESATPTSIGVRLDRTFEVVTFDPRRYFVWDHGYATTVSKAQGASVRAIGGIVDGAATAEAWNVLISRSKEELLVLVPRTAFQDVPELAEHLRHRIVAKGTTQDISAELAQRDGPDTYYAMNARAQQLSASNPLRQQWEREWTAMRKQRDIEIRELAAEYRAKVAIAGEDPEQKKQLRLEQRKAEAAIGKAYQPEDFGVWLHRRQEHDQAQAKRVAELDRLRRSQRTEHDVEIAVGQAIAQTRAAEQARARPALDEPRPTPPDDEPKQQQKIRRGMSRGR